MGYLTDVEDGEEVLGARNRKLAERPPETEAPQDPGRGPPDPPRKRGAYQALHGQIVRGLLAPALVRGYRGLRQAGPIG